MRKLTSSASRSTDRRCTRKNGVKTANGWSFTVNGGDDRHSEASSGRRRRKIQDLGSRRVTEQREGHETVRRERVAIEETTAGTSTAPQARSDASTRERDPAWDALRAIFVEHTRALIRACVTHDGGLAGWRLHPPHPHQCPARSLRRR